MADKEDGPPHLENPNSPSYVCVECHNNEDSLCLECHEMAQLPPNPNRNGRKVKDDAPTEPRDAMSGNDSTSDDSAYHASTICDSPTSTTSTLDLNPAEHSNDCNESHGIRENLDEAGPLFSPRYKPTTFRLMSLFGAAAKGSTFKPLILGKRFNSDSDSDYTDMPPLEETKKKNEDYDEDTDDMPPLEDN